MHWTCIHTKSILSPSQSCLTQCYPAVSDNCKCRSELWGALDRTGAEEALPVVWSNKNNWRNCILRSCLSLKKVLRQTENKHQGLFLLLRGQHEATGARLQLRGTVTSATEVTQQGLAARLFTCFNSIQVLVLWNIKMSISVQISSGIQYISYNLALAVIIYIALCPVWPKKGYI